MPCPHAVLEHLDPLAAETVLAAALRREHQGCGKGAATSLWAAYMFLHVQPAAGRIGK